jgi:hypothetical protein
MTEVKRSAATCRWATPTLFLQWPLWLETEASPWACVRAGTPRILATTDQCAMCPHWEARAQPAGPTALDWFSAFPPPHEVVRE